MDSSSTPAMCLPKIGLGQGTKIHLLGRFWGGQDTEDDIGKCMRLDQGVATRKPVGQILKQCNRPAL